ncbi:MAG: radical SAM protein [Endomicrobiia bacterium]|nr:radical SAM protein [Endomicrobiia bacterium]
MKIFLANPPLKYSVGGAWEKYYIRAGSRWPHSGVKRRGRLPHYLPFPFFLAYAAAVLKENGFDVKTADGVAMDMYREDFLALIKSARPDAVFFEAATPTITQDLELAGHIKREVGAVVIFGGTHVTTHYAEVLSPETSPDYVIRGEYEFALLGLMKALAAGKSPDGVKGVCFSRDGVVVDGGRSEVIEPLDKLPYPAYDMFPSDSCADPTIYWDGFCQRRPAVQMHASRGCPYGCYFCLWPQVMYGSRKYRRFSSERVVSEMAFVARKYGAREIYFDDDDFTIDARHVAAIADGVIRSDIGVKWSCMGDAINLDEELIRKMAASGCIGIKFGVESGSREILEKIGKPVDLDKVRAVAAACARRGIKTHATFSVGLLGETEDTVRETFEYAASLDVDSIQVSVCTPYPGTRYYEIASEEGLLKTGLEWADFDGAASGAVTLRGGLSGERLKRLRAAALKKWIMRKAVSPRWVARQLRNIARAIVGQGPAFFFDKVFWGIFNGLNFAGRRKR